MEQTQRKGLEHRPLDSPKLDLDKIPKMADILADFNCHKEDVPPLILVIKQADGSQSHSSSPGTILKKFF